MPEQPINPTFSWLFEDNPIGAAIRAEIESKVAIATAEKDKQIADLQTQVDELTTAVLMGGSANV